MIPIRDVGYSKYMRVQSAQLSSSILFHEMGIALACQSLEWIDCNKNIPCVGLPSSLIINLEKKIINTVKLFGDFSI